MEVTKTTENLELEKVIAESGLQLTEGETIKQSYLPYFEQMAEIKEQAEKINFENPTELDEKIARELRLRTVKIRTGSEQVKNERKRIHALKANVEQDSWNLIKSSCLLDEEKFLQVEKKRELEEKRKIDLLTTERKAILSELIENSDIYPVGFMTEDAFNDLVNGFKLVKEENVRKEKEAELKRIEDERIAKENAEKERIENEKIKSENERLKKEAEEKEAIAKEEREAQEKALQAEKDKAAAELAEIENKAKIERETRETEERKQNALADQKLKEEREAREKVEKELQDKKDAEEKAAKDKIAAEKKAAKAPDKEKLNRWVDSLHQPIPEANSLKTESQIVAVELLKKFEGFKSWAKSEIEKL